MLKANSNVTAASANNHIFFAFKIPVVTIMVLPPLNYVFPILSVYYINSTNNTYLTVISYFL
ncbi:MAG: hypothetical protein BSOLF_0381 [Candidatus Carbobacillus altaicus]|uniref:Uncharacterized protein n=1 Tax=Candidatus Carbonibacillus altaicus TaxID=2163959 RepID=A0A2R6Y5A9_9BACL|nr:MAG: hypothetical protein BSOLF_0381 [Candidatus Carbobacillus altaicus]